MGLKIRKDYLPRGDNNRPGYKMTPKGLLFHTTNNWDDGAGDEMHAEYMESTSRVVSWHDTVDKDSCTLHIPHNENAWHAGDGGKGYYNRNWIGMEIACEAVDRGQRLDKATYDNAVERAAQIVNEYNFGWDQLQPHNIVYGKNCPHTTLFSRNQFKRDVFARAAALKRGGVEKAPVASNGDGGTYEVQSGDTLSEIAVKFNTTVSKLVQLNGIKDKNKIAVGQKIQLPNFIYTVERGDSLSKIAEMHDTDVDYLVRLNDLEDPDKIYVGQRIKLQGTPVKKEVKKAPVKKNTGSAVRPYPGYSFKATMNDPGKNDIEAIQRALKVKVDGWYGPKTADAVREYQRRHGLKVDGIVGINTWNTLF